MALAGLAAVVYSSPDNVTYTIMNGINSMSFGPKRAMLDVTAFAAVSQAKNYLVGLREGQFQISGDYLASDTGQSTVRTQYDAAGACWLRIWWDGSAGHKCNCFVSQYDVKTSVAGKVEWSATLEFNAQPIAA